MSNPYRPAYTPPTQARDVPTTQDCKPSCCKSPYGHSTGRDQIPAWHKDACHCHDREKNR